MIRGILLIKDLSEEVKKFDENKSQIQDESDKSSR